MSRYAVTGASGQLGRLVITELLKRDVDPADVVAIVRTPSKADDLRQRGVEVRTADYSDPSALRAALAGVDRLLLISSSVAGSRVAHHVNVIEAAQAAGVSRIAYTSILDAEHAANPLAGEHRDTERALRRAAIPFTLLRNGWYTENYTAQLAQYLDAGEIVGAAGTGRISAATRRDYAAAAAAALLQDTGNEVTYELGGPSFDLIELAETISQLTGTQVAYRDLSSAEYASALVQAGLDEPTAGFIAALDAAIAAGELETDRDDLARLSGQSPTTLADAVRAAAGSFSDHEVRSPA